jgi:DNA polymerase-3 subunit epsilon/ATP-dependent DNA helicase DinG
LKDFMAKTYVALDLETTGLDPMRDAIIEIGALRFEGERQVEKFSTFVNPGRKIPPFVTELTGITDRDVESAPGIRRILPDLAYFVGRDPVVGHNIGFDLSFLRQHNTLQGQSSIDTFELAGILVPHAGRYSLANLVRELAIDLPEQTHRALDDAVMAHALFIALLERAAQLPQQTLRELVNLGARINWAPGHFFRDALYLRERQGFRGGIGAQLAARRGGDAAGPLFVAEEEDFEPLEPREEPLPIDVDALSALLDPDGRWPRLSRIRKSPAAIGDVAGRCSRLQRRRPLAGGGRDGNRQVARLFAAGHRVGSAERAARGRLHQHHQLAGTVGEQRPAGLRKALYEFRTQILKGRSHYLCRHQFQSLRRRGPMAESEMTVLAKVLIWLPNTLDGDADGLFMPTTEERGVWHTLSAANEACDPSTAASTRATSVSSIARAPKPRARTSSSSTMPYCWPTWSRKTACCRSTACSSGRGAPSGTRHHRRAAFTRSAARR